MARLTERKFDRVECARGDAMVTTESTNDSNPLIDRVLKRARGLIATHGVVLTVGSLLTVGLTRAALTSSATEGPTPSDARLQTHFQSTRSHRPRQRRRLR